MDEYCIDRIRDVVLLGAGGCGKTTIVEAMAFASALTNRLGNVNDGNTISDYDKEEIKRKFSINTSIVGMEWEGCSINILDTPGNLDFVGERELAASAADAAVIVVNGKSGVEAGTIKAWELCDKYQLPRIVFVTAMDDDDASYRQVVEDLTARYGKKIAPFHQPIRQDGTFIGYVNVIKMNARRFTGIANYEEIEIPEYSKENLGKLREILLDSVAATSDELMEKYFDGGEFTQEEINEALKVNCWDGTLVPVTMGSGLNVHGVFMLLNDIARFLPPPYKAKSGINVKTNQIFDGNYDCDGPFAAQVFKTISDPFMGKYSLIKVYSGMLREESTIFNSSDDTESKISKLYVMRGKDMIGVKKLLAGEIGAITKLSDVVTGDTISTKANPIKYKKLQLPTPYTVMRYIVKNKNDDSKVLNALGKIMDEDTTLNIVNDVENEQSLICGIGNQQLEIVASKLYSKYKIEITLERPKVAFRETICKKVTAEGRYKKQTGGHGQFGDVTIRLEPSGKREIPYIFEEEVVGGTVPKKYFPAIEKGIAESIIQGPLAAYPVVGMKATLLDGSYHSVDSSEMAFKMASMIAFKNAYKDADPILLEPIMAVRIYAPEKYTGDIINDLKTSRARILGMLPEDEHTGGISAQVPMDNLFGYCSKLRSITEGFGEFEYEFVRYGQVPDDIQKKQVEQRKDKIGHIQE